ncbi:hypothetical protein G9U51_02495 [Calidifontibacter sp. DB0510]|uniref:PRC-barrel domain containing protein n=1 Tax=Metallococcus carri TaxID=1656884 RepID=A0A967AZF8_9MICO|nr:hypothetical protein [Metallococcus carri]NHN54650.1 hypothetical protein [Metallococcus carri]NOP36995.1 hypothetical protein [Calidifontibacter sp. DB2511S]
MAEWEWEAATVDQLLDVQIYAADGEPLGKVDDLEFTTPSDGGAPVLTAILCGPSAFGPRLGGLVGLTVWAIGRRLSPTGSDPVRVPMTQVDRVNRREIRLRESARPLGTHRFADWTREHIVCQIPGGSR